jgi:hypothetical protein
MLDHHKSTSNIWYVLNSFCTFNMLWFYEPILEHSFNKHLIYNMIPISSYLQSDQQHPTHERIRASNWHWREVQQAFREVLDPRAGRWSTETIHNVNIEDSEVVESRWESSPDKSKGDQRDLCNYCMSQYLD